MLSGELLDRIDVLAREATGRTKALGGIQLIVCADFGQLAPVDAAVVDPDGNMPALRLARLQAFDARVWADLHFKVVHLRTPQRHTNADQMYMRLLHLARHGPAMRVADDAQLAARYCRPLAVDWPLLVGHVAVAEQCNAE